MRGRPPARHGGIEVILHNRAPAEDGCPSDLSLGHTVPRNPGGYRNTGRRRTARKCSSAACRRRAFAGARPLKGATAPKW